MTPVRAADPVRARAADPVRARAADPVRAAPPPRAYPDERIMGERRTVTIRGQVADRHRPSVGPGPARRRPPRSVHERAGSNPDRIAMWAVLLGVILVLAAATSSHAAVITRVTVPAAAPRTARAADARSGGRLRACGASRPGGAATLVGHTPRLQAPEQLGVSPPATEPGRPGLRT